MDHICSGLFKITQDIKQTMIKVAFVPIRGWHCIRNPTQITNSIKLKYEKDIKEIPILLSIPQKNLHKESEYATNVLDHRLWHYHIIDKLTQFAAHLLPVV